MPDLGVKLTPSSFPMGIDRSSSQMANNRVCSAIMDNEKILAAIGIEPWQPRQQKSGGAEKLMEAASTSTVTASAKIAVESEAWQQLEEEVSGCKLCTLEKTRTQTVFGTGSHQAKLMIIGEAPGADEDRQGKPFVGRAGMLLTEIIRSIGLSRREVFIANILKCRPPDNRDPLPCEVRCCTPYLQRQIHLVRPKLMVALGRIAAHFLLDTQAPLGKLRGQLHHYGDLKTPLLVTYHPAYLLRSPGQKAKSYQDMHRILQLLKAEKSTIDCKGSNSL